MRNYFRSPSKRKNPSIQRNWNETQSSAQVQVRIDRLKCLLHKNAPRTLTAMTSPRVSTARLANGILGGRIAALFTSTSQPPHVRSTSSQAATTDASSRMSHAIDKNTAALLAGDSTTFRSSSTTLAPMLASIRTWRRQVHHRRPLRRQRARPSYSAKNLTTRFRSRLFPAFPV